ncbi:hypothetical protein FTUN_5924 [Frigoriglobus tundricola]|uniref:Uncharacterized protein n=1 Tax=Frigoriglobus tundricola TaxID=2774151 RepID=A0A6M5YY44_9BACT|nr:hypothetical protein FTUN_5924 [Frigoriglobus tundricola]
MNHASGAAPGGPLAATRLGRKYLISLTVPITPSARPADVVRSQRTDAMAEAHRSNRDVSQ